MHFITAGAAVLAATVGIVNAQSVDTIQFSNFDWNGVYKEPDSMTSAGCGWNNGTSTSGNLSPLNEEIIWHYRGPLQIRRFAAYSINHHKKTRRSYPLHPRHGHAHLHAHQKQHEERDMIVATATINGVVKTISFDSNSLQTGAPAPVPQAPSAGGVVNAAGNIVPSTGDSGSSGSTPYVPTGKGDWVREAYYDAPSQTRQGITFLNTMGGGGSGVWDATFGNSLSYASSDGLECSASSQTLQDTTLGNNVEVLMSTDKPCKNGSCGFVRPGALATHGFDTNNKVFVFEFQMPSASPSGQNGNMPAIWGLNSKIDHTAQYAGCSCWANGCGELDVFEVIPGNFDQMKATFQGVQTGNVTSLGANGWFDRPTSDYMIGAVMFHGSAITIKKLPSFSFAKGMSDSEINGLNGASALFSAAASSLETVDMAQVFG